MASLVKVKKTVCVLMCPYEKASHQEERLHACPMNYMMLQYAASASWAAVKFKTSLPSQVSPFVWAAGKKGSPKKWSKLVPSAKRAKLDSSGSAKVCDLCMRGSQDCEGLQTASAPDQPCSLSVGKNLCESQSVQKAFSASFALFRLV
eukprot:5796253-Amphidinium_carterae.4